MKTDLRISIKDFSRNKSLRVTLVRAPFGGRQFLVRMNGRRWPEGGKPVSITRVFTALLAAAETEFRPHLAFPNGVWERVKKAGNRGIGRGLVKISQLFDLLRVHSRWTVGSRSIYGGVTVHLQWGRSR